MSPGCQRDLRYRADCDIIELQLCTSKYLWFCHPELAKDLNALQYRRLEILRKLRMTLRVVNRDSQFMITGGNGSRSRNSKRNGSMKKIVFENYDEMSRAAAEIVARQLKQKPNSVLGLATGSTPLGLYAELIRLYRAGEVDFAQARSFNLDEYYPISKSHPQSYYYYMHDNLFSKVNFASTRLPDGETDDPAKECTAYDAEIAAAGSIDLQVLGIGLNGHIGFNEPAESYSMSTYLVELTQSTLAANSRFFTGGEVQPTSALTMGFGSIFSAKSILLLISGASKAPIVKRLFDGKIHTDVPACLLLLHPNVTVILDKEAAGENSRERK